MHRDDSFLAFGLGSIFQNIAGLAVVHGDAQRARDLDDRPRHVDVGARGSGIAGGMVVQEHIMRASALISFDFYAHSG